MHGRQRRQCKACKLTVTTGRKPKTPPAKKTKKSPSTEDDTSRDEVSYDSDEGEEYKLEESEEVSEGDLVGDVSTAEPIIDHRQGASKPVEVSKKRKRTSGTPGVCHDDEGVSSILVAMRQGI